MARKSYKSCNAYKVSVPGSLMLMGEHAVLRGYPGLVAAIDKRMCVKVTPRSDHEVSIQSTLGTAQWSLDALPAASETFQFLLAVIRMLKSKLNSGIDLNITAEFSDQMGFGSSAAVVVGSLAAIWVAIYNEAPTPMELWTMATQVIREVQGFGSGADAAASIFGGVLGVVSDKSVEKIAETLPLTVVYSGAKCPTSTVVNLVNQRVSAQPEFAQRIFETMQQGVLKSIPAIKSADWQALGHIIDQQQSLMHDLGVSTPALETLIEDLRKTPGIFGAKISGSGLGDCIIGIGTASLNTSISTTGIQYEVASHD